MTDIGPYRTLLLWLCYCLLPLTASAQSAELFPRPPELQPAVDFWVKVYTEVDTQSGFLHDARNLTVIYASLPLDRRQIEATRSRIREDLRVLASGQRQNLSRSQQQILELWGADVSNQTLRDAVANVRWQLGQSNRFLAGLRRSGAYRQHIAAVIREKNLPPELGVLPHVESSFNPSAFSSASAAGMWQFGRATGQRFMRIDHIVDERMDPYIATEAAMSLLQYNHTVLGTWPLALTAYNHGAGGIARAVRQTGTTDIETIVANYRGRAFGFASRNFYAQFLAVLELETNTEQYFGDVQFDPAPEFVEVSADAFIDAEVFARSVGISLEQLRADNPALRPVVWEGNKRIPRGFPIKLRSSVVGSGNVLASIPNDYKFAVQTPDVEYVVERGDSLSVIASRFNTTVGQLVSLNQLASRHRIQIGQRLLLPRDNINANQLASATVSDTGTYTVRRGDTVSLIAARYNVPETELLGTNGIRDRNRIYPGQELQLPGYGDSGRSGPVIAASATPVPPTQLNYGEDSADESEDDVAAPTLVTETPKPTVAASGAASAAESTPTTAAASPAEETAESAQDAAGQFNIDVAQLALVEDLLPPAAVLPDNQELDTPVSAADERAVAIDPAINLAEADEQLSELLSADPSDYSVAANSTIEIQATETLGHYAEWLGIRAWDLRRLNNMAYQDPVIIGERLKLDFTRVNSSEFERQRREYHSAQQQKFFASYRIQGAETYRVRRGDNIGQIARNRYSTPIWLLRQYNPELDFGRIQINQEIVFPLLQAVESR